MIREANEKDLNEILELYLHLHEDIIPEQSENLLQTRKQILHGKNHHLIINEVQKKIVSSCVFVIIPNLTRNVRPYAIIENVVTHRNFGGQGLASECLEYAKKLALQNNCYKIMLLTGSKDEKVLNFYKNNGYSCTDKTAFVQKLDEVH